MISLEDFFPKYPTLKPTEYDPYEGESFNRSIFRKREFYENRLSETEQFPKARGQSMLHQKIIARYMSSHTPYDKIILVHEMGSGKGCTAIGAIEQIKLENSSIDGAMIFARGKSLLNNFIQELVFKCTSGEYVPDDFHTLSDMEKVRRIDKYTRGWYKLNTFEKFAKNLKKMSDELIKDSYSNKIIVIDEGHNLRTTTGEDATLNIYDQFFRMLHLVKNCKVMILTGTPMKDTSDEVAGIMNLILPLNEQLPTDSEFKAEFLHELDDGSYVVKAEKIDELKKRFRGRISFLKSMKTDVHTEYEGEVVDGMKHIKVYPLKMSGFQTHGYDNAYETDESERGVFLNARQAALFVFPDGSTGKVGFTKYIDPPRQGGIGGGKGRKYKIGKELRAYLLKDGTDHKSILKRLKTLSVKYAFIIEQILENEGKNAFVYGWFVEGSGIIIFSLLLQLFGMEKATGKERTKRSRYAIVSTKTSSDPEIRDIIQMFNHPENARGDYCRVIVGSSVISEGFSLANIQKIFITTAHWNYSETSQAIARGIRLGSHNDLIALGETPIVQIYQLDAIPDSDTESINTAMFSVSELKDISIQFILRLMRESAFDCALNYYRNISSADGTRDCEYMECEYTCDGVDPDEILHGINPDDIDQSTYNLYYIDWVNRSLHKKVENFIRNRRSTTLGELTEYIEGEEYIDGQKKRVSYTEFQLKTLLSTIIDDSIGESQVITYEDYTNVYVSSIARKLIDILEEMFRVGFSMDFATIRDRVKQQYTQFELLTALRLMITQNMKILNRYGFPSYLREDRNIYFLVDRLSIVATFPVEYYTEFPSVKPENSLGDIMDIIIQSRVPDIIGKICDKSMEVRQGIKQLPIDVQEILLETAVTAQERSIEYNADLRKKLLDYFSANIKTAEGVVISDLMFKNGGTLRCFDQKVAQWKDCDERLENLYRKIKDDVKARLENNKYKVYGMYNRELDAFCIRDLRTQTTKKDGRKIMSGSVCKNWDKAKLFKLIVEDLSIEAPSDFESGKTVKALTKAMKSVWNYAKTVLDVDTMANEPIDRLRQILYWAKLSRPEICTRLKSWFEANGLMEESANCGTSRKTDKKGEGKKKKACREDQVINPKNGRCVKKTSKLGREIMKKLYG